MGGNGRADLTSHGFRSTFRDWAAERTNFPSEVVEMALAHAIDSKVEAAYRRGDLFAKRRLLMAEWAKYCGRTKGEDAQVMLLKRRRSIASISHSKSRAAPAGAYLPSFFAELIDAISAGDTRHIAGIWLGSLGFAPLGIRVSVPF